MRGEPGIGKSALLREAREQAVDMQVLEGFGIESEAQLAFAGLHQLLRPVLDHAPNLPGPQAAALRSALGLDAGGAATPFLVYLATLTLLSDVAGERPLLCLVDDAQWFDDASADALVFVARRLSAEPMVVLLAARDGEGDRFDVAALPELHLAGLDATSAGELLDRSASVPLAPAVRRRLVEGTGGNPLALLELPSTLSDAQRSGAEPVLDPLPVGTRVERAFLARVRRLPEDTQTLLLVAAADDTGRLAVVLDAAAHLGVGVAALDAAERDGLVLAWGGRIELRHPLVRSAIYQAAPLSQRQMVHGALANALDADADAARRAWHRAAASTSADPRVIAELEEAARRARKQSGYSAASRAFERAASLTTSAGTRARLLTAAADNAWWAGQLDRGRMLVEAARPLVGDPALRAELDRLHGLIEWTDGVPAEACELLIDAARHASPGDALLLLAVASNAAEYAGDPALVVVLGELAGSRTAEASPFLQLVRHCLVGLGAVAAGNFDAAVPPLRRAVEIADGLEDDGPSEFQTPSGLAVVEQPVPLLFAGRAALRLGDDDAAHRIHRRAAMQARSSGASSILTQVLPRLALCELWAGRWPSAAASAKEGLALAQDIGQGTVGAHLLGVATLLSALRGDEDECRSRAEASRERATSRGLTLVGDLTNWALTVLELGLGRPSEAFEHARRIVAFPTIAWAVVDRVEAAARAAESSVERAGSSRSRPGLTPPPAPGVGRRPCTVGRSWQRTRRRPPTSSPPHSTHTPAPLGRSSGRAPSLPSASCCDAPAGEPTAVATCRRRSRASRGWARRCGPTARASSSEPVAGRRASATRAPSIS